MPDFGNKLFFWEKLESTPNIHPEYERYREEILNQVENGWESDNWQAEVEKAHQKLGQLIHPRVSSTGLFRHIETAR
jgi:hypothetical protein